VSARERRQRFGVSGGIVLLVTPPGGRSGPLAYAVERALFDRGGSAVLLSAEGGARWLSAARAVADAGLLAVVTIDSAEVNEQRARAAEDEGRLLVIDESAAAAPSAEEGAKLVVDAVVKRGWLRVS
jgi:hypothetical protein